jgi:hypothetical protein
VARQSHPPGHPAEGPSQLGPGGGGAGGVARGGAGTVLSAVYSLVRELSMEQRDALRLYMNELDSR